MNAIVVGDGVRLRIVATRTDDPYQDLTWEEFCFRSKAFPAQSVLTTLEFAAEVVMHASSPAGNLQKALLPRTRIPSVPLRVVVPDLSR